MQVIRVDVEGFLQRAGDFLRAQETEHNLLLGLSGRLVTNTRAYGPADPYFVVVEQAGRVVAAALRTPPYNLLLSETQAPGAYAAIAADVQAVFDRLPGVTGPAPEVTEFVSSWQSLTGDRARLAMRQRIYEATAVLEPRPVDGRMRVSEEQERELVASWIDAFALEALPDGPVGDTAELMDRIAADPAAGIVVWEHERPVSLACYGNPTPRGIRIGPVYTPPPLRRRGYASALVAALTRQLLGSGRPFCFLFTDLANPTSNSVYEQVGYRGVSDVEQWQFERPESAPA